MSATLDAALARARAGEPVLPVWWTEPDETCACPKGAGCPSAGKHPLTARGFYEASLDPKAIGAWFRRQPRANLAVHTIRFPRIDIDSLEVAEALRDDLALPLQTQLVETPSTGLHIVLATPGPVATKVLHLSDGRALGELRGEGAYVLVPPSCIGGRTYKLLSPPDVRPLEVEDPLDWLAALLGHLGFL